MISALRDFIPVTGNTHDLQNRRSELGAWFMKTAASVNSRVDDGMTSQGFYVVAADGTAYGFNNNRSIDRVVAFMAEGLKKYRASPPVVTDVPVLKGGRIVPPDGATVLRVYSRITPVPEGCGDSNKNLQRDHLWVLPGEVSELQNGAFPEALKLRLLRFCLVDAVRGEPDFWTQSEVESGEFKVTSDGTLTKIKASFSMKSVGQSLSGTFDAELSIGKGRLTSFKGYADCTASGSGTWTPGAPEGYFPLKFAFVIAPEAIDTVAPQAAMIGREYLTGK